MSCGGFWRALLSTKLETTIKVQPLTTNKPLHCLYEVLSRVIISSVSPYNRTLIYQVFFSKYVLVSQIYFFQFQLL